MVIDPFTFARCPRTYFGKGAFGRLGEIAAVFGGTALIVTGARSLDSSGRMDDLTAMLESVSVDCFYVSVDGEPSPEFIDAAVSEFHNRGVDVVLGIGGGSAIDAGKAISAMLPIGGSVLDFLEGVGTGAPHSGLKAPFVAVPTTAGTGSEATKNAVLSKVGEGGFKVSLRHDNLVPDVAVVDPELTLSCPRSVTASCGMDAFTQLLESYVSTEATPMTEALAASGIKYAAASMVPACALGSDSIDVRAGMAYAAYISGVTLANAGLGLVHGFAAAVGGLFDIPHGVICGTLLGPVTRANIRALALTGDDGSDALGKYAAIGELITGEEAATDELCAALTRRIDQWTVALELPLLGAYGVRESDVARILEGTGLKNNPVKLDKAEMANVLLERI